ncbi:MAG: response regulator [Hyphomicrobiaceae bacterium]|nr:response regulator [Hyphomicrobiaceae bacterium]
MVRILLADDDANVRGFAERALSGEGHVVVTADDGADALRQLESGSFDLLISDLDMPGVDGFELVSRLPGRLSGLKVLLISGHAEELKRAAGLPPGRSATLSKPFTLQQIRGAVAELLAR